MRSRDAEAVNWIERALTMPGADAHPALRIRALCIKAHAMWLIGRGAEQRAALAEAEAGARALGDPLILSSTLRRRAKCESGSGGCIDLAEALADEALDLATAAEGNWEIALAADARATAVSDITELRARVDWAAALLGEVCNVYHLADLIAGTAYAALCMGSDRDAMEFVARATRPVRALGDPFVWMMLRGNLGLAALSTGETDAARQGFREEPTLCRDLVVLFPFAIEGLAGLAAVSAIHGDDDRAARLVGAAAEHRYGQPEDPVAARLHRLVLRAGPHTPRSRRMGRRRPRRQHTQFRRRNRLRPARTAA